MKKLTALALAAALAAFVTTSVQAGEARPTEAKVLKVTGSAQVKLPGVSDSVALTPGMTLPIGATITTADASAVDLQPANGILTTIQANATVEVAELSVASDAAGVVTQQTATLELKAGRIISTLDPAKKAINRYGIRTSNGVAAARGTAYVVTVTQTGSSVATLSGTVTLTPVGGGAAIEVDIATGMAVTITNGVRSAPVSLTSLVQAEKNAGTASSENSITSALAQAVKSVSDAVQNNTIPRSLVGPTAEETGPRKNDVSMLAAVINVAAQANPEAAADYTQTAINALKTDSSSNVSGAMSAIIEAAAQGAVEGALTQNAADPQAAVAAAAAVTKAIQDAANIALVGQTDTSTTGGQLAALSAAKAVAQAVATGAATGTTNSNKVTGLNVQAPVVTAEGIDKVSFSAGERNVTTKQIVVSPVTSTPITPIDTNVVSPSGGQR